MTPELGALITLALVLVWLRLEARRVRLSGMLHVEPVNESLSVVRLQNQNLELQERLDKAIAAMDAMKEKLDERDR